MCALTQKRDPLCARQKSGIARVSLSLSRSSGWPAATREVSEYAGIVPGTVRGQDIGTFIGVVSQEYGPFWHEAPADVQGKLVTGTMHCAASGRLSHFFGLSGPCITVDTGCSASLVGVHLGVQSLRSGECSMALVGGAAFLATPGQFTEFTRQGALSSDGKCKAFAEAADGT